MKTTANITIEKFNNINNYYHLMFDSKDHQDYFETDISVKVYEVQRSYACILVVNDYKVATKHKPFILWYLHPKDVSKWLKDTKNKDLKKIDNINQQISNLVYERDLIQNFWRTI